MKFNTESVQLASKSGKISRIAKKCGTTLTGGVFCFDMVGDWYVVDSNGYYKYNCSAQAAAVYGTEGVDYWKFKDVKKAVAKANRLLLKLNKDEKL